MGFSDKILFCAIIIGVVIFVFNGQDIVSTSSVTQTVVSKGTTESCLQTCWTNYWIYTDKETLQDSGNIFAAKMYSGAIYDKLQVGHTYNMTVIGWKIPMFAWYRNIIQFEEVNTSN